VENAARYAKQGLYNFLERYNFRPINFAPQNTKHYIGF